MEKGSPKGGGKGRNPQRFQGFRKGKASSGGLKAGVFARMREPYDAVAFAIPGRPTRVKLYEEVLDVFESQGRQPRNLVVIVCENPDSDKFEAFQTSFEKVLPLLQALSTSPAQRPYWSFILRGRNLLFPGGDSVDLKKVEKRAVRDA